MQRANANTHNTNPPALIGVLDSGVGGLSVLREIHRALPAHPTYYLADQAHVPYGPRPISELFQFSDGITRYLLDQGARVIVMACNTASAASLHDLRAKYPDVPFVGMEPAVKPAVEATRTNVIGVLSTQVTASGELFKQTVAKYASHVRVVVQVAPALVQLVERGDWESPEGDAILRDHLTPLMEAGADQIALACTHFPFLIDAMQRLINAHYDGRARLIDPSPAVARQVRRVLERENLLCEGDVVAQHVYSTTGSAARLESMLRRLIAVDAPVQSLAWDNDARAISAIPVNG